LAAYRAGRWDDARAQLSALQQRNVAALAGLYGVYDKRLAKLAAAGVQNWDGVYDLEEK
jgi:hypothetical protein